MSNKWVLDAIKDRLEEAKKDGNWDEVKELELLLVKRKERGIDK